MVGMILFRHVNHKAVDRPMASSVVMLRLFVPTAMVERQQVSSLLFSLEPVTYETMGPTSVFPVMEDLDEASMIASLLKALPIESMYSPTVPENRPG